MLTPLKSEILGVDDLAHEARRFRTILWTFERNMDLLFKDTGLVASVNHEALAEAFQECPRHHQQEAFPFEAAPDEMLTAMSHQPPSVPKESRPRVELAPPLQLRIEVWRDSKRKRRQTRVVRL